MSSQVQEIQLAEVDGTTPLSIAESREEPKSFLQYRKNAFKAYQSLPVDRDTLFYKYTKFTGLDFTQLRPSIPSLKSTPIPAEIKQRLDILKRDTSALIIETSAGVKNVYLSKAALDGGIILTELKEAIKNSYETVSPLLNKRLYGKHDDKLAALNGALATNRTLLYVPKNVILENPIRRLVIHDAPSAGMFSELLIYTESNSSISLIEELYSDQIVKTPHLLSLVEEVHVGANAQVKMGQLQNLALSAGLFVSRRVGFKPSGKFESLCHLQGSAFTRMSNELFLSGSGCDAHDLYTMHGTERQRFDIKSQLTHQAESTIGATNARCIMRDRAESTLRGLIHIEAKGKNADSWLKAEGLLQDKGQFNAVPALAIDNNEVRAAHAATVSQVDEEQIFYLLSRGIPESRARRLVLLSYLEPILSKFGEKRISHLIRQAALEKWHQERAYGWQFKGLPQSKDLETYGAFYSIDE
ncbi:MAG: SufD family Fe-S cluster assembly protein [Candidatus Heimdallarchaeota archaeon]